MGLTRILSRASQLIPEPNGGNILHGEWVALPPICSTPFGTPGGNPARQGEFVDPVNPQLRLTQGLDAINTDFQVDGDGNLRIIPTGGRVGVGVVPTATL